MQPVRIKYDDLVSSPGSLAAPIEHGLGSGPDCLGIVVITDLPSTYPRLRERLLRLSQKLATLPDELKETLVRPETSYSFGWSHGKEIMNGRPDTAKGSFYANPLGDPSVSDEQKRAYPEYYSGNVWPEFLDGFEDAFKGLGRFVADVGIALARACDTVGFSHGVAPLIEHSQANKARLLHYYPASPSGEADDACGTHIDHSLLTGLCSAMYLRPVEEAVHAPPMVVDPPSKDAGLWIFPRGKSEAVKVSIPADCLAFQTGEALQVLSGGKLAATPHYVSGGSGSDDVSRETFAFFLQPDVDDVIGKDGETFGQFTKTVLDRHYDK